MSKNLFWVITFLTISIFCTVYASEEIPFCWEGTITVVDSMSSTNASGVINTTWNLHVKWEEAEKVDVKDKKGRLVGQFISLKDCGSSWEGKIEGTVTSQGMFGPYTQTYSGKGGGKANLIAHSWIYYSLSDDDPLKDILPNGSYSFGGHSQHEMPSFDYTITRTNVDSMGAAHTDVDTCKGLLGARLNYYIGGRYLIWPFEPGGTAPQTMSAESLKMILTSSVQLQISKPRDAENRVITDERMKGSYNVSPFSSKDILSFTASWDLGKRLNITATLYKADKSWRPKSAYVENNNIKIKAEIDKYKELEGKFQFTLYDVGKEKGYCMNAGDSTDLDLKFFDNPGYETPQKTKDGWTIESTKTMNSADVNVWAVDYGAWGCLKAKVNVKGEWYECESEDGKSYIIIPYDDNENHIADYWEEEKKVSDESADTDNDQEPDGVGKENGDGFTNYEEYRGFVVNAVWTDTSPTHKDIFIYDEKGGGIGIFSNLGLDVHLIDQTEYDEYRTVNFNRGYATLGKQKGLYLREEDLATGRAGEVRPCVGSPNVVDEVVIDISDLGDSSDIAHELGHAVNIMHHGDDWVERSGVKDPTMVAERGGKWSGDIACVMRYEPVTYYLGIDGKLYEYPENEGAVSLIGYCSARNGTGMNAPPERIEEGKPYPVAGDAAWGECRKNVTLKGEHRWGN